MTIILRDILHVFGVKDFDGETDIIVNGFQIDSRKIRKNDVFVAIRGEHQDGHDFIAQAFAAGACMCLSEKVLPLPRTIVCQNTTTALAQLASWYRAKLKMPLIAVTGSSGKTTTKNLLKHVLGPFGKTEATKGNLNNHWGVPLTLLDFAEDAKFGIVEMGMNHAGEIAELCRIATPDIGLITNIGPAHIEHFDGKLENIAKAKGELFAGLVKNAIAIVNADDPLISALPTKARKIAFGFSETANVRAMNLKVAETGSHFDVQIGTDIFAAILPLVGSHHVQNALAALAVGHALGLDLTALIRSLADFQIETGRGGFVPFFAGQIMDDTYNANPGSMRAAFETLVAKFPKHQKIGVLGDMLELGNSAEDWHLEVGRAAKKSGLDELYAFGPQAKFYLAGFGYSAIEQKQRHFDTHAKLSETLAATLQGRTQAALLIKGSRGMKMETVVQDLVKRT